MNECPTRARTGTPPCSRTISGTARDVIRLWITVVARVLGQRAAATSAVIADGETGRPRSSTTKQRSASPSKASPTSAPTSTHLGLQVAQVGRVQRVGLVVGEAAVELEVQRDDRQRQPASTAGTVCPAIPLPASTTTVSGRIAGEVDQPPQVVRVRRQQVALLDPAAPAGRLEVLLGQRLDLAQAGVLADRGRAGPAQLDPVVAGRVVARGEHRAGQVERAGGEVEQVGRAEAGVQHVGALGRRALGERGRQRGAGLAHVSGGDDPLRAGHPGERRADRARDLLVQLVGDHPADVVRLDDGGQVPHPADRTGRRDPRVTAPAEACLRTAVDAGRVVTAGWG